MTILWICGLPEEVCKVHPVTDVPSAAWSWVVGHLPPPKDVELHIICPVFGMKEREVHFVHGGAQWHCFRLKRREPLFLRLRFYWSIRAFVKKLKPDVVHGWGGESGCGLLATYCSPFAVVSVQGLLRMLCANARQWHIQVPEMGSVSAWFRRRMENRTYRRAHCLLVESETAREGLRTLYGLDAEVVPYPLRPGFVLTQGRVTAPCGWARPLGKRPSRAERVPRGAEGDEDLPYARHDFSGVMTNCVRIDWHITPAKNLATLALYDFFYLSFLTFSSEDHPNPKQFVSSAPLRLCAR